MLRLASPKMDDVFLAQTRFLGSGCLRGDTHAHTDTDTLAVRPSERDGTRRTCWLRCRVISPVAFLRPRQLFARPRRGPRGAAAYGDDARGNDRDVQRTRDDDDARPGSPGVRGREISRTDDVWPPP